MVWTGHRSALRAVAVGLGGSLLALIACTAGGERIEIPAGTVVAVALDEPVDSDHARRGQEFAAVIDAPVTIDGETIVAAGDRATVRIVEALPSRDDAVARLTLRLGHLDIDGHAVDPGAAPLRLVGRVARETRGAGLLGAVAGAVTAVSTDGSAIRLAAGQPLLFHVEKDVAIPVD